MGGEECESFSYLSEHLVTVKFFYCLSGFFSSCSKYTSAQEIIPFCENERENRKNYRGCEQVDTEGTDCSAITM